MDSKKTIFRAMAFIFAQKGADAVPDEEVKKALLEQIHVDGFSPWLVLDDRDAGR